MNKKPVSIFKTLTRFCITVALVVGLVFAQSHSALAARTGGGFGGGSFRRPSVPTRMAPARPSAGPSYGYGGYGGGFGFPFMLPFLFGGGGSLFTLLVVIAIASFVMSSLRNITNGDGAPVSESDLTNPPVSVSTLQLGLLAEARDLQPDLDRIALNANTSSAAGLAEALQESTLALLRHPEYWVYAQADEQKTRLLSAEAEFNRRTLSERSKFQQETLSNYSAQLKQKESEAANLQTAGDEATALLKQAPGEYIVVTLIVAAQGNLGLPKVQSAQDVKQALSRLGAVGAEELLAMRVLWTPQASGDTLTADDLLESYPKLLRL